MMTLANPHALWLLALLPAWGLWRLMANKRRTGRGTFLFSRFRDAANHGRTFRARIAWLPEALLAISFVLATVALARPQAMESQEAEVEGIDIYLSLDMSWSMLGIDMTRSELRQHMRAGKPPVNRFNYAVETLKDFVVERKHDRLGMVVFARDAYLQFPLTLDANTILNMLRRLKLGDIDGTGTAIGNALGRSIAGLKESDNKTRLIILITDGDRRGGNISPRQAAELARDLGIKIFPILVGKEGIALQPTGRDLLSGHQRYEEQKIPVNPELLKELATITGGTFYRASDKKGLQNKLHEILDRFDRSKIQDATNVEYQDLYHGWLWWSLVLLVTGFMLRHTLLRQFP